MGSRNREIIPEIPGFPEFSKFVKVQQILGFEMPDNMHYELPSFIHHIPSFDKEFNTSINPVNMSIPAIPIHSIQ